VNDLPGYVWAAVLTGVVGLPAATVATLARGALAARLGGRPAAIITIVAGTAWAAWLAGSVALADAGVYRQGGDTAIPWIAVWFNVLGIADLAVAVGIGFLAGPGPTNLLHVTPTTEALTMLPLALIPATAVPLAVALHLVCLQHLRTTIRATAATTRRTMPAAG
jgi:hypothetical protein